jgi:membrane protein implicated in regulation of membrane protease activity
MQAIRRLLGINVEFFWIVVGIGFGIGGLWEYLDVQTPLAPIVLIIAGIALLVSVTWFGRKHSHQQTHHQGKQE